MIVIDNTKYFRTSFLQLLERRVGKENIAEALDGLSRSEFYIQAAQRPQPLAKTPQDLKLEYQFTKLVKSLESALIKIFRPNGGALPSASEAVVASYKKLIKQQDEQIAALTQEMKALKTSGPPQINGVAASTANNEHNNEIIENLRGQLAAQTQRVNELSDAYVWVENAKMQVLKWFINFIIFFRLNTQWQNEVQNLRGLLKQWQEFSVQQVPEPHNVYCQQLLTENRNLEAQLNQGWAAFEKLTADYAEATKSANYYKNLAEELQRNLETSLSMPKPSQDYASNVAAEDTSFQQLSKEHEDLLVLLAEQDGKLTRYKQRLRAFGENISEDETDA